MLKLQEVKSNNFNIKKNNNRLCRVNKKVIHFASGCTISTCILYDSKFINPAVKKNVKYSWI